MSTLNSLKTYFINISKEKKYPVVFGQDAASSITHNDVKGASKALIITNKVVQDACKDLIQQITDVVSLDVIQLVIEDGEHVKHLDTVSFIIWAYGFGR